MGFLLCVYLYWGGERRGGLLLLLLGSGFTGAFTSLWLRGRRLLVESGFSMLGLLRRGKLFSVRVVWRYRVGFVSGFYSLGVFLFFREFCVFVSVVGRFFSVVF